jgi:hypothetical protein
MEELLHWAVLLPSSERMEKLWMVLAVAIMKDGPLFLLAHPG